MRGKHMKPVFLTVLGLCLVCGPVVAQETKPDEIRPDFSPNQACTAITDNGYDGTIASMTC